MSPPGFGDFDYDVQDESGATVSTMRTMTLRAGVVRWSVDGRPEVGVATRVFDGAWLWFLKDSDNGRWSYVMWNGIGFKKLFGSELTERFFKPIAD